MTDMTDRAIAYVREQKTLAPDKPFFIYFAPGATHAPHQVPKEWVAKSTGQFDMGWDKLRKDELHGRLETPPYKAAKNLERSVFQCSTI
jgi:arylsulfatase A-like enzyme